MGYWSEVMPPRNSVGRGIMNAAMCRTVTGKSIAAIIVRFILPMKVYHCARSLRLSASEPDVSAVSTISISRGGKWPGCFAMASARVLPAEISLVRFLTVLAMGVFKSVVAAVRHLRMGRPAASIVARLL